jgi:Tol biopolymer transport system component
MSSRARAVALGAALLLAGCDGNVNDSTVLVAVTDRVSVSSFGVQGDQPSLFPSITPDGRFVAFTSNSSNLFPGVTAGLDQVYVRDRTTGTTTLVSVNTTGQPGDGNSSRPSISANGRWVAFQSVATDLVGGDANGTSDIFVRDLSAVPPATIRVSVVTGAGAESAGASTGGVISGDGAFIAFESDATDLTPDTYAPFALNVFRHPNSAAGTTDLISITTAAVAGTFANAPSISGDGAVVAFLAFDTDLTVPGTSGAQHVFLRDLGVGLTELVSRSTGGVEGNQDSDRPFVSSDGLFVAFESFATNLAPDTNGPVIDIFVRDRTGAGATSLVSLNDSGFQGTGNSQFASVAPGGRFVVFISASANLVMGDANGVADVFWRDRLLGITRRVSVRTYGAEANGESRLSRPVLTADGRFVAFQSAASNLVINDANGVDDIFVHGPIQ